MSQLPISAANSTNFPTESITNGIPFALGDISFIDTEKYICVSFSYLQDKNATFIQHQTQENKLKKKTE